MSDMSIWYSYYMYVLQLQFTIKVPQKTRVSREKCRKLEFRNGNINTNKMGP